MFRAGRRRASWDDDADNNKVNEFLEAIKEETPVIEETHSRCYSDIEHSVPIMEGMLVGCIAQRVPGVLCWDSCNQVFTGSRVANELVKPYIRSGWNF